MAIRRAAFTSMSLASATYWTNRNVLEIEFRDRAIYRYFNVPVALYESLRAAQSAGTYFNAHLRGRFPHRRRIRPPDQKGPDHTSKPAN